MTVDMNRKILIGAIAVVVVVGLGWFFLSKEKKKQETIKVGVVLPLTGTLGKMGEMERDAMLLATKQLKDSLKIKLFFEDNQSKTPMAVNAVNKLININKVDLVITSTTGASLATQPVLSEKKTLQFAFCMDTEVAKKISNNNQILHGA
jgi:branched-chain amino acid transport system substrate-binding protein